jgi:hypothetical protein
MSIPPKLEDSVYQIVATMKKKIKNRRVDGKLLSSRIPRGTLTNQQFVLWRSTTILMIIIITL